MLVQMTAADQPVDYTRECRTEPMMAFNVEEERAAPARALSAKSHTVGGLPPVRRHAIGRQMGRGQMRVAGDKLVQLHRDICLPVRVRAAGLCHDVWVECLNTVETGKNRSSLTRPGQPPKLVFKNELNASQDSRSATSR